MTLRIGSVEIGGDNPCRFVFELSNAHNGSLSQALRLLTAAKDCGADFAKIQAYTVDELIALRGDGTPPAPWDHMTMRELYGLAQTPLEWLPELFQYARDIELPLFSSVFGLESLVALEKCACPAYKIARLDNHHDGLLQAVSSRGKPVIVSATEGRLNRGWPGSPWKLYCAPGYPTADKDVRLPWLFAEDGFVGISSHCMNPLLPPIAVARGCKLIEMHGMLDDCPSNLESNVSLTASQFSKMIQDVRAVEEML
jgi:pseudaminic acid synthase